MGVGATELMGVGEDIVLPTATPSISIYEISNFGIWKKMDYPLTLIICLIHGILVLKLFLIFKHWVFPQWLLSLVFWNSDSKWMKEGLYCFIFSKAKYTEVILKRKHWIPRLWSQSAKLIKLIFYPFALPLYKILCNYLFLVVNLRIHCVFK